MKTGIVHIAISLVLGIASFWLILEGPIIGPAVISLIVIGLGFPSFLRALRIGTYFSGLGLTGAGLMGVATLTTAHCPLDGSVAAGGCAEGGGLLTLLFAGVALIGLTLLFVAALKRKGSQPSVPTQSV
ncbi:MAG TPA: hypothetical protein VNV65_01005 [Candidatus Solibacter sp.]|jgi:hypothetical protein|nr:hypothetical protein [Candidatus Solibacter sp.]